MKVKTRFQVLALVAVLAALTVAAPARAQFQQTLTQPVVDRGANLVKKHINTVARYMYPASTVKSYEYYQLAPVNNNQWTLSAKVHFEWLGEKFWADQHFHFDLAGNFLSTSNGQHNTTFAPGTTVEAAVAAFRPVVRDAILAVFPKADNQFVTFIVNQPTGRGMLNLWISSAQ